MNKEQMIENYYSTLDIDKNEREIICLLLSKSPNQFKQGLTDFSKMTSNHVGAKDLIRLLIDIFPIVNKLNSFQMDNGLYLTPKDVLALLDSIVFLEILFEEFKQKSGRRSFFISSFKSVKPDWVFFAYEMVLCKALSLQARELLALSIGLNAFDLQIISKWSKEERIKAFIQIAKKEQIGIFQDGTFIGFQSCRKINDVEDVLKIIFDEINMLTDYFSKNRGVYFEQFPNLKGITALPKKEIPKPPPLPKVEKELTPVEKSLRILKIKELPSSQKELKKVFYQLAMKTHPDKFEHVDKGTKTEIAILDKFREIQSAYEIIELEIERKGN